DRREAEGLHHRGPRAHRVEVRPAPRHHPRLPRPLQPVTAMTAASYPSPTTSTQPCCEEYAAMQRAAHGVSRRGVLGGALALAGASTVVGGAVVTASPAAAASAASV